MARQYKNFKKLGSFTLSDGKEFQGLLHLNGSDTSLELYSTSSLNKDIFTENIFTDIHGLLTDGSKVSLLKCIVKSEVSVGHTSKYCTTTIFPQLAVFGSQYIQSSSKTIYAIGFTVSDASILFHDPFTFGSVIEGQSHLERILNEKDWGKEIEVGEQAHLFYFSGKHRIAEVETDTGKILVTHKISYPSPSTEGIRVKNTVMISIEFKAAKDIDAAVEIVLKVLRFLEIIAGRPQHISDLELLPISIADYSKTLGMYWCTPPRHSCESESKKPHFIDMLLQAAAHPEEFGKVLRQWLERDDKWKDARYRFSMLFSQQDSYSIDRIVGAANMFDILPPCAVSASVTLPPETSEARENARKMFLSLPISPERDSILSSLGRMGKPSLKRKVRSRVKLITDSVGDQFPELEYVTDQAVDCRNYYVHGSVRKVDYGVHVSQVVFLTSTLEFVFAVSDLIESGWNINAWITKHSTLSHPFSLYKFNYAKMLAELKKIT